MQFFSYDLGFFPLDWELCFLDIDEYKAKLEQKYQKKEAFYKNAAVELTDIFTRIDELLKAAQDHWNKQFPYQNELRCPPMISALPKGDHANSAVFCIVLKRDEDGDTIVYSQVPLPHLEE